ncbi:CU044_5270 family protein [Actinocorallia longicatena]|uniref:CU044_5270 family protein n=1 Tax=Actinocorallia longicatena TaxID=111803 RepID=A0ABP6QBL2_9ACTN
MNDIDQVRAFRAEVPLADRGGLAPGRALLLAEAARPAPRLRPAWRLGLAATAAAAVLAAGIVVLGDAGTDGMRPVSVGRFLESAAAAAEKEPDVRPGPHQWLYTKVYQPQGEHLPEWTHHTESWQRFDGLKTATRDPGPDDSGKLRIRDEKWVKHNTDSEERTPTQWYDYFRTLPRDPAALLAFMTKRADSYMAEWKQTFPSADERDQWVFRRLSGFLDDGATLPKSMRATIYRAVAKIPGVTVKEGTADSLGRPGISVIRTSASPGRHAEEFILAKGTYSYLGWRVVATADHTLPAPAVKAGHASPSPSPGGTAPDLTIKAGTVLADQSLEASGLVPAPGDRP